MVLALVDAPHAAVAEPKREGIGVVLQHVGFAAVELADDVENRAGIERSYFGRGIGMIGGKYLEAGHGCAPIEAGATFSGLSAASMPEPDWRWSTIHLADREIQFRLGILC